MLWRDQASIDASIGRLRSDGEDVAAVMALVADWQMIELDLLGGKGTGVFPRFGLPRTLR